MTNYIFTIHPTFTQGLLLGQLSVFFLLALILKYLFWDTGPEVRPGFSPPSIGATSTRRQRRGSKVGEDNENLKEGVDMEEQGDGSLEWLNGLLLQVGLLFS
jgi:maintenance of morphology protein 1